MLVLLVLLGSVPGTRQTESASIRRKGVVAQLSSSLPRLLMGPRLHGLHRIKVDHLSQAAQPRRARQGRGDQDRAAAARELLQTPVPLKLRHAAVEGPAGNPVLGVQVMAQLLTAQVLGAQNEDEVTLNTIAHDAADSLEPLVPVRSGHIVPTVGGTGTRLPLRRPLGRRARGAT